MADPQNPEGKGDEMTEPRYLICKYGLYYAPNSQGYTGIRDLAGRYSLDEVALEYPNRDSARQDGIEFVHEDDAPEFSPKCWDDLKVKHLQKIRDALQAENAALKARAEAAEAERDAAREVLMSAGIALHVAKRETEAAEAALARAYMAGRDDAAKAADYAGAIQDQRDGSYAGHVAVMGRDVGDIIRAIPVPADLASRVRDQP